MASFWSTFSRLEVASQSKRLLPTLIRPLPHGLTQRQILLLPNAKQTFCEETFRFANGLRLT
jgi:hypothetical protein